MRCSLDEGNEGGVATLRHVSQTQRRSHATTVHHTVGGRGGRPDPARADGRSRGSDQRRAVDLESGIPLALIGGLQVFNLNWDTDWNDAGKNDGFSTGSIDAATQALANSNFNKLEQYRVPDITWGGSATAVSFPCTSDPGTTVSSLGIVA
jgi:hypothetical protein